MPPPPDRLKTSLELFKERRVRASAREWFEDEPFEILTLQEMEHSLAQTQAWLKANPPPTPPPSHRERLWRACEPIVPHLVAMGLVMALCVALLIGVIIAIDTGMTMLSEATGPEWFVIIPDDPTGILGGIGHFADPRIKIFKYAIPSAMTALFVAMAYKLFR